MPPLYAVICLLSLLNKEAGLFNSQAEYRQVGSPYKGEGGKRKQSQGDINSCWRSKIELQVMW